MTEANARPELATVAWEILKTGGGNVGAARRTGVQWALDHCKTLTPEAVWIACTDADSEVPKNWIERQLQHAEAGADAVAGIVRPTGLVPAIEAAFEEAYRSKIRDGSHGHIHGANLGFRGSSYIQTGGFSPVPCHEDRMLWDSLVENGHRVVADCQLIVATSGRSLGRLRGGFASDIANLRSESGLGPSLRRADIPTRGQRWSPRGIAEQCAM